MSSGDRPGRGLSAILAAMGLFGVASFNVTNRTREIGIRLALGASRGAVERMILREVVWLVAAPPTVRRRGWRQCDECRAHGASRRRYRTDRRARLGAVPELRYQRSSHREIG